MCKEHALAQLNSLTNLSYMHRALFNIIKHLLAGAIVAMASGCTSEQLLDVPTNELYLIAFDSYIIQTKGTSISDKTLKDFGVVAYHTGINNYDPKQPGNVYMDNVKVVKKTNTWKPEDKEYYWPNSTDLFSFFGYAPYHASSKWITYDTTNKTITLQVDSVGSNHIDFLYSNAFDQTEEKAGSTGVVLNFEHTLTKIILSAQISETIIANGSYQIKRVIIGDSYTKASLTIGEINNVLWDIDLYEKSGVIASIQNKMLTTDTLTTSYKNIFKDDQAFFMIPQYLADTHIYMDVLHPDGNEYRSEALLKAPTDSQGRPCWKKGEAYNYRITYHGMEDVAFSVECITGSWDDEHQNENIDDIFLNLSEYKFEIKKGEQRNIYYFTNYDGDIIAETLIGKITDKTNLRWTYVAPDNASNDTITVKAGTLKRKITVTVTD